MAIAEENGESREIAGEYVLGVLDASERAAFETRLEHEPDLAAEVARWKKRLAPLDSETPAQEPPAGVLRNVFEKIDGTAGNTIVILKRRAARWRNAAAVGFALAACLALAVILPGEWRSSNDNVYVASLHSAATAPAFLAAVDTRGGILIVRRIGRPPPPGRSYELWALGAGRSKPQALGLVNASARIPAERLGALDQRHLSATIFAVSLEPLGGSPTGAPTGPVLFTGRLLLAKEG